MDQDTLYVAEGIMNSLLLSLLFWAAVLQVWLTLW